MRLATGASLLNTYHGAEGDTESGRLSINPLSLFLRTTGQHHHTNCSAASSGTRLLCPRSWCACSCATHCSLSMPSKHFLRCGCTRVASLVSLRISSISSLDRKKKRGNASRLSSRYAARPYMHVHTAATALGKSTPHTKVANLLATCRTTELT